MDYFGINSADDLPKIKEVLAEQMVEPTIIKNELLPPKTEETENELLFSVTEEGELIEKENEDENNS